MSEDKIEVLRRAFEVLDSEDRGEVSIERLKRIYDAGRHPYVTSHKKTRDEVLGEFLEEEEEGEEEGGGERKGGGKRLAEGREEKKKGRRGGEEEEGRRERRKNVWLLTELDKEMPAKRTYYA